MSSNPFKSARESLLALFDETRKKVKKDFCIIFPIAVKSLT